MPKIKKTNPRNMTTLARAGRDLKRDLTIFLKDGIFFTLLRGRSTRIVRSTEKLKIPGIKVNHPKTTTRKSRTFHASFRYAHFPIINPFAMIFKIASIVKKHKKYISASSTNIFRQFLLLSLSLKL